MAARSVNLSVFGLRMHAYMHACVPAYLHMCLRTSRRRRPTAASPPLSPFPSQTTKTTTTTITAGVVRRRRLRRRGRGRGRLCGWRVCRAGRVWRRRGGGLRPPGRLVISQHEPGATSSGSSVLCPPPPVFHPVEVCVCVRRPPSLLSLSLCCLFFPCVLSPLLFSVCLSFSGPFQGGGGGGTGGRKRGGRGGRGEAGSKGERRGGGSGRVETGGCVFFRFRARASKRGGGATGGRTPGGSITFFSSGIF